MVQNVFVDQPLAASPLSSKGVLEAAESLCNDHRDIAPGAGLHALKEYVGRCAIGLSVVVISATMEPFMRSPQRGTSSSSHLMVWRSSRCRLGGVFFFAASRT